MTPDQAKRAVALLRSIVSDINSMHAGQEDYFGGFSEWFENDDGYAVIEWPNLSIVGHDIAEFLATLGLGRKA